MSPADTEQFIRDKKDKEKCYNYLVAEYLNTSEENKTLFLTIKGEYEIPVSFLVDMTISPEIERIKENLSCYRPDIVLECLNKLISIFDIKYDIKLYSGSIRGFSGVIPFNL